MIVVVKTLGLRDLFSLRRRILESNSSRNSLILVGYGIVAYRLVKLLNALAPLRYDVVALITLDVRWPLLRDREVVWLKQGAIDYGINLYTDPKRAHLVEGRNCRCMTNLPLGEGRLDQAIAEIVERVHSETRP